MYFKAVIFDLDGTLLDTLEDLADSTNCALRSCGYPEHSLQSYKYFVGNGIRALVESALPETERTENNLNRCVESMKAEYARRWTNKTLAYPGIPELLEGLGHRGYGLNILSNKKDEMTREIVAKLLSSWHFDVVQGARSATPKKPDPAAALGIAARIGLPPEQFLFVGDTAIDMQTARAAGMYGVGALWGFRPAEELIAGGARILLSNPQDLLPWL
jgi:phosphoglycolate phosphatase